MIKIENTHVDNIVRAVYSARNAMNSWDKSDSDWETDTLGKADLDLAKRLSKAGNDHAKYLRMINVTCDITAPLYWVAEHDTYKVSTVRNSCSFMHRGVSKPFEINDFTIECGCESEMLKIIDILNYLRNLYLESKDFKFFRVIRQLLPQGYNVRYTWHANYQVLKNIYFARQGHRLEEWHTFCDWIEGLPYSELIIECGRDK